IFQRLYEQQRHPQALLSHRALMRLHEDIGSEPATLNLLTLYRLNQGPIATTLDNKREPFLPVANVEPGKNVYPWGVKKEEIENDLTAHPEHRREIIEPRAVVRAATLEN